MGRYSPSQWPNRCGNRPSRRQTLYWIMKREYQFHKPDICYRSYCKSAVLSQLRMCVCNSDSQFASYWWIEFGFSVTWCCLILMLLCSLEGCNWSYPNAGTHCHWQVNYKLLYWFQSLSTDHLAAKANLPYVHAFSLLSRYHLHEYSLGALSVLKHFTLFIGRL